LEFNRRGKVTEEEDERKQDREIKVVEMPTEYYLSHLTSGDDPLP